jgi:FKBP-type peptidyl-prolyl cis-trans isomerase FkpA
MRVMILPAILLLAGCGGQGPDDGNGGAGAVAPSGAIALPSGDVAELTGIDVAVGDGEPVERGDTAVVHYTGWLYDPNADNRRGAEFDSSRGRSPFSFQLGAGRVIDGWEVGVEGMRTGGRRLLFIPPEYGYGERGFGATIPPNSTLVFDVELVEIIPLP